MLAGRTGQILTLLAVADDAAGQDDALAVITWAEVDGAVDADGNSTGIAAASGVLSSLAGSGTSCTATAVAAGSAFVAAIATDPDGNVKLSPPFAVAVVAGGDAATVTVTASFADAPAPVVVPAEAAPEAAPEAEPA
jgi:hypothetical protein